MKKEVIDTRNLRAIAGNLRKGLVLTSKQLKEERMKNWIFSIIAVATAVTVWHAMPAFAAKIDVGGELRARAYMIQSADFTETGDANWLDARFRLDAKISQGMTTGVVQLDFLNASTDSAGGAGMDSTGNLILGNDTGNSYPLVGVRQAYLAINFPAFTVIGGRYEAKLGNGLVLNDTADLVAVVAPVGPVNLLVGYLLLGENDAPQPAENPAGDDTAFAVNAGLKNLAGSGVDVNLFLVSAYLQSVDPGDTKLQVVGLTGNGKVGPANVAAELDIFSGDATSARSFTGTNFLLSGGMPVGSIGLNAAILYASGDSDIADATDDVNINTIDGDFRASNILVRDDFNNYEGVSSLSVGAGALGSYLINGLGLQAIKVAATLPSHKMLNVTHTPEIGLVYARTSEDDADGDNDLGVEIYANTNCVFDQNLSGNIGLAFVSAGDALAAAPAKAEDQLKIEASLTFHF